MDPGEVGAEATVWYNWTPTVSGNAQIAVNQHGFDSQVEVYTGASVTGLTFVASNDDANDLFAAGPASRGIPAFPCQNEYGGCTANRDATLAIISCQPSGVAG
jgi:hypothetical protein